MTTHGFDEWFTASDAETAALLTELAAEVDAGTVSLGRTAVEIPDELAVELEYEHDGDEHELELELTWEDVEDDADGGRTGHTVEGDESDDENAAQEGDQQTAAPPDDEASGVGELEFGTPTEPDR